MNNGLTTDEINSITNFIEAIKNIEILKAENVECRLTKAISDTPC